MGPLNLATRIFSFKFQARLHARDGKSVLRFKFALGLTCIGNQSPIEQYKMWPILSSKDLDQYPDFNLTTVTGLEPAILSSGN